jgi:hypothetical protein
VKSIAERRTITVDGNEAAASVAHRVSDVIAIYPITPSSAMRELSDEWSNQGRRNLWGNVPDVVEMQSLVVGGRYGLSSKEFTPAIQSRAKPPWTKSRGASSTGRRTISVPEGCITGRPSCGTERNLFLFL